MPRFKIYIYILAGIIGKRKSRRNVEIVEIDLIEYFME